ncbi:MAG: hypothetical protein C0404_07190 [Verrucomicrobia bacterium]|nr:hypothetical protein [Verrucomicrobiota bacterium]
MEAVVQNIADVIVLVVLFGLTIFVHELGHFLVALRFGMVIDVFSLGFGPAIWQKKIRGITYKIAWFPVGGYVALPQLDPSGMATIQGSPDPDKDAAGKVDDKEEKKEEQRVIPPVPPGYKICVAFAGAVGNIILAFILAMIIYLNPNSVTREGSTIVGSLDPNCSAYKAGLRVDDEILMVNDRNVNSWYEFRVECHLACGRTNVVEITAMTPNGKRAFVVPAEKNDLDIPTVRGIEPTSLSLVQAIVPQSPAARAGLQTNDIIKRVGDVDIRWSQQCVKLLTDKADQDVPIVVDRKGKLVNLTLRPSSKQEHNWPFKRPRDRLDEKGTLQPFDGPWESMCMIQGVWAGSPAEKAGLKPNDIIRSFAGERIDSPQQFSLVVTNYLNQQVPVVVERESGLVTLQVTPLLSKQHKRALLGIVHESNPYARIVSGYEPLTGMGIGYEPPPWMQFKSPFRQMWGDVTMILRVLEGLVTPGQAGQAFNGLGGPISIFVTLWFSIQLSLLNGAGFLRFLNVNLAILNLLPLPVLDGGHVVFALWEAVTRRKPNAKFVNVLVNAFAALLIALFVFLLFRDTRFVRKLFFNKNSAPIEYVPAPAVTNVPAATPATGATTNASDTK